MSPASGQSAATSPCLIAALRTPFDLLRNVVSGHSVEQFIERVTRLTRRLEDGAQHQCSVFDSYFGTLAVADFKGLGDGLRDAHGETISPPAKLNDHDASPQSRDNVYTMQLPTLHASKIRHQTPLRLQRLKRRNTLFQSPNASGRSRQGEPVRTIQSTPSTNIRLSRPVEPFWSGRPMISGAIRSHAASLKTNRSITPKTASPKAALNLICS